MAASKAGESEAIPSRTSERDAFYLIVANAPQPAAASEANLPPLKEIRRWTLDPAWRLIHRPEALKARRRMLEVNRLCFRSSSPGTARPFALDTDSLVAPSDAFSGLDHFLRVLRIEAKGASAVERAWMRALAGHSLEQYSRVRNPYIVLDREFKRHPGEPPAGPFRVVCLRQRREWGKLHRFAHTRAEQPGPWALVVECPSEWGERQIRILAHEIMRHMSSMKRTETWREGCLTVEAPLTFSMTRRMDRTSPEAKERVIRRVASFLGRSVQPDRWKAQRARFEREIRRRAQNHGTNFRRELLRNVESALFEKRAIDGIPWILFGNVNWSHDPQEGRDVLWRILGDLPGQGLLGKGYRRDETTDRVPLPEDDGDRSLLDVLDSPPNGLEALVAAEEGAELKQQIESLLTIATPGQAELLQMWYEVIRENHRRSPDDRLSDADILRVASDRIGIAVKTARKRKERLLERLG